MTRPERGLTPVMSPHLDYDRDVHDVSRLLIPTTLALLPVCATGCIQDVDLRNPALLGDPNRDGDASSSNGDAVCGTNERIDPDAPNGLNDPSACAPCTYVDPKTVCPCDYLAWPAEFPVCEGPEGNSYCFTTCTGNVTRCNAYREIDGVGRVRDCSLLRECCDLLGISAVTGATTARYTEPCCEPDQALFCFEGSGTGEWRHAFLCLDCCAAPCTSEFDCDRTFQTCKDNRCVPGCDVRSEYCDSDGSGCLCRPL